MVRNRLSPSRRPEDIRAWWAEDLAAQRKSGRRQAAYQPRRVAQHSLYEVCRSAIS